MHLSVVCTGRLILVSLEPLLHEEKNQLFFIITVPGKHCGFLAVGAVRGLDTVGYVDASHPIHA